MSRIMLMLSLFLMTSLSLITASGDDARADEASAVQLATLMRSELEGVEGTEVIVSLVELPPVTELPGHYHPGEEFIYVLEGSGTVRLEGGDDVSLKPGDTLKIPFKQAHSAVSGEAGIKVLVFRVHETGQPERFMTE